MLLLILHQKYPTSVLLNVILNFILIPKYAAFGAAIASFVTQSITAVIQVGLSVKIFKFKLNYKRILQTILFVVALFVLSILSINLNINWGLKFLGIIALSVLLAFVFGLIKLKFLYQIIRYDED